MVVLTSEFSVFIVPTLERRNDSQDTPAFPQKRGAGALRMYSHAEHRNDGNDQ
jgi:hypothetical protein